MSAIVILVAMFIVATVLSYDPLAAEWSEDPNDDSDDFFL